VIPNWAEKFAGSSILNEVRQFFFDLGMRQGKYSCSLFIIHYYYCHYYYLLLLLLLTIIDDDDYFSWTCMIFPFKWGQTSMTGRVLGF